MTEFYTLELNFHTDDDFSFKNDICIEDFCRVSYRNCWENFDVAKKEAIKVLNIMINTVYGRESEVKEIKEKLNTLIQQIENDGKGFQYMSGNYDGTEMSFKKWQSIPLTEEQYKIENSPYKNIFYYMINKGNNLIDKGICFGEDWEDKDDIKDKLLGKFNYEKDLSITIKNILSFSNENDGIFSLKEI